jgi:hypothetical protein
MQGKHKAEMRWLRKQQAKRHANMQQQATEDYQQDPSTPDAEQYDYDTNDDYQDTSQEQLASQIEYLRRMRELMPPTDNISSSAITELEKNGVLTHSMVASMMGSDVANLFSRAHLWRRAIAEKCSRELGRAPKSRTEVATAVGIGNVKVIKAAKAILRNVLAIIPDDKLYDLCLSVPYIEDLMWLNKCSERRLETVLTIPEFWADKLANDSKVYYATQNLGVNERYARYPFYGFDKSGAKNWEEMFNRFGTLSGVELSVTVGQMRRNAREDAMENYEMPNRVEKYRVLGHLEMPETWTSKQGSRTVFRNWKSMVWLIYFDHWLAMSIQEWWQSVMPVGESDFTSDTEVGMWSTGMPRNISMSWSEFRDSFSQSIRLCGVPLFDNFARALPNVWLSKPFEIYNESGEALSGSRLSQLLCQAIVSIRKTHYSRSRFDFPSIYWENPVS